MNTKNKFVVFFIFFSVLTLSIFNIKNPEKIKFYLFTSKIEELSLGNYITISFITGFTFSSLLTLITKNSLEESLGDKLINEEETDKSDDNIYSQELEYNRPPERDVRESQPTISVNYRFIDQDKNPYSSKNTKKSNNNLNNEENDWLNYDNEW
tara:strand:+ start:111 stop:572 length:462 start_codon:yes stop_codon:yes gene_type:complete